MIRSGTSKQRLVLGGEKRKTLCTRPLSIAFPRVSEGSAEAKTQPWPPGYKHDMKYECEQRPVTETKHSCLSTVHWVTSSARGRRARGGGCIRTHHRPYHNKWPSRVFVAGGWEEALRQHCRSTLQPWYQTQFGLFTMPECPMAKAVFFYFILCASTDGNKPKTNQFSSSASSWQSVAMDIQCGCMFTSKWRSVGVKGESKTHNSKQLLLLLLPPPAALRGHLGHIYFSHMLNGDRERFSGWEMGSGKRQKSEVGLTRSPISSFSLSR